MTADFNWYLALAIYPVSTLTSKKTDPLKITGENYLYVMVNRIKL